MKKIISLLLLVYTFTLCLTSCTDSPDNNNISNNNFSNDASENIVVEHGNVNGKCPCCDLYYFDVLRKIVLEKGELNTYGFKDDGSFPIELVVGSNCVFRIWENDPDALEIRYYPSYAYDSYKYLAITFNRANIKYGEYTWYYNTDPYSILSDKEIRGTLVAAEFKEITNTLPYSKEDKVTNGDTAVQLATSYIKKIIMEYIPEVLEYGDYCTTAKHFGFVHFE